MKLLHSTGTDLGVGRGGRCPAPPPLLSANFFFCKQRLLDVTSCFVTLDIFSLINIINNKIYRKLFESTALIKKLQTDKFKDFTGVATVTGATVERKNNSSVRFVKSDFRSTMREDRLNTLLLLIIHKDIAPDYDAIIDYYTKRNQRRMTFIIPLQ